MASPLKKFGMQISRRETPGIMSILCFSSELVCLKIYLEAFQLLDGLRVAGFVPLVRKLLENDQGGTRLSQMEQELTSKYFLFQNNVNFLEEFLIYPTLSTQIKFPILNALRSLCYLFTFYLFTSTQQNEKYLRNMWLFSP